MRQLLVLALVTVLNANVVLAQSESFDVATVRLSGGGLTSYKGGPGTDDPERLTIRNYDLKTLLVIAFDLKKFQIAGPGWIDTTHYDINANVPAGTTREQARKMLQNLLAERLKLRVHRETREFPAYDLVVTGKGPKLELVNSGGSLIIRTQRGAGLRAISGGVNMAQLVTMLRTQFDDTAVVNKTGLDGLYKFTLEFVPIGGQIGQQALKQAVVTTPEDLTFPSIFTALQEQLGLKLEKSKAMFDVLVVDAGEKTPTAN